nr:unnamed protein product [Digitaria exilis]
MGPDVTAKQAAAVTVLAAHAEEQRYLLRTYEIMTRKLKAELRRHRPPHSTSTKFPPSRAPPPPPSYPEASSPHSGPCSPGNLAHAALLSNGIWPTPCSSPRIVLLCRWSLASHRAPLPLPFSPRHPATAELKQEHEDSVYNLDTLGTSPSSSTKTEGSSGSAAIEELTFVKTKSYKNPTTPSP